MKIIEHELLNGIPERLRQPLLVEMEKIDQLFYEARWDSACLAGGRFAEVAYSIVRGNADGSYPKGPMKPRDMVAACREMEKQTHCSRSVRILIPRLIVVIYEIRNNRDSGHIGGEVPSNKMDALLVLDSCRWILAELIRLFHDVDVQTAMNAVKGLSQPVIPVLWPINGHVRVLNGRLNAEEQVLVIANTEPGPLTEDFLRRSVDYKNAPRFRSKLRQLHNSRLIEYDPSSRTVSISPIGRQRAVELTRLE